MHLLSKDYLKFKKMLKKPGYINNVTFSMEPKVDPNVEGKYTQAHRPR